jgi:hypothetical protein
MSAIGSAEYVKYAAAEACADESRRSAMVARVITAGAVLSMFITPATKCIMILNGYKYNLDIM